MYRVCLTHTHGCISKISKLILLWRPQPSVQCSWLEKKNYIILFFFFSNLYHYLLLYLRLPLLQEILFPTSAHQVSTSRSVWFSCWEAWPSCATWEKPFAGELWVFFPFLYESWAQSIPTLEMQGLGAPWRLHSLGPWGMVLEKKSLEGGVCTINVEETQVAVNKCRAG